MELREVTLEDAAEMKRFEAAFVQWLKPWQVRVHPMLVAITLVRCARTVLRLCSAEEQTQLLPVMTAFLQGKTEGPSGADSVIWTPGQGRPQ